ncbi:PAS domain S-box protein [Aquabacterium fontiphilum]|jgi:PAS domain S-box-containing protein|uniref:PAS domain S-box protein n=1 Tax=Aquabacterium fontiphilum TaxID=450365 RepID=UPI0013770751|nr:PAS domain S-box protein [Aquabacterium fontiphilum]NBD20889.1 PAS domain S-box protein [Aquabacterium fontiphilum]
MATSLSMHMDDAWFDVVPLALLEFNAHGRVLRGNSALSALLGYATPAGSNLADCPQALQRLCGWDAPLTLLALGPEDPPLQAQVAQARAGQAPATLRSQVWAQAQASQQQPRRFLCAIRETASDITAALPHAAGAGIVSDADAAPVPDQAQLLHELSTILESTPAGIAYLRGNVLVRCNRRFERMLGLTPGTMAGQSLEALLAADPRIDQVVAETTHELQRTGQFESELEIVIPSHPTRWYALSVRRIGGTPGAEEVIVVLSDITGIRSQQAQLEALGRDRDLMFTLSGVGIAFVKDGLIQSANPALAQLLGEDGVDLAGRPLVSVYASDLDPNLETDVMSVLRSLGHWQGERALRHARSGHGMWAEVALRLVQPGRPEEGLIASFVNVDARHRAEHSLTLQADRTRAILDSVFVGIVTLDAHGIAWMNRSARRMFGGDLADFLGQPLSTVATPDLDHPFRLTDYLDELEDGQSHTFECQVVGRDGRVFWVVGNAVVTLDESNQRHITYALLDIDRRRQAEAQSAEAQATLQRIIEMAPMAIQLVDAHDLRLLQANQAASAYMGREAAHALQLAPDALYSPDRARLTRGDLLACLDAGQALHREYSLPQPGGNRIWDVNYLPLARDGQGTDQVLVVASDITEQRAAEQARLEAAIAQREMLVREVHHRIKNNLQGVAGLLQQIASRKPEVAPAIAEVVGQVQAIAQVYGLQVGAGGPLRLRAVVEAIAHSVQRTFGRTIELQVLGDEAGSWLLPEAESIPIALSLNELLTNAHKHGPGADPLLCTLRASETAVEIDIDNPGQLPEGFSLDRVRGGVSGLGLVRALLPRRSARLTLTPEGGQVRARVTLTPPGIHLAPPPPSTGEPTGHQIALWPQ